MTAGPAGHRRRRRGHKFRDGSLDSWLAYLVSASLCSPGDVVVRTFLGAVLRGEGFGHVLGGLGESRGLELEKGLGQLVAAQLRHGHRPHAHARLVDHVPLCGHRAWVSQIEEEGGKSAEAESSSSAANADTQRMGIWQGCAYPEELVAEERADHGGLRRSQARRHRARPAMMDHGRHTWHEPVMRHSANGKDHIAVLRGGLEGGPGGLEQHAGAGAEGGVEDEVDEALRVLDDHGPEADEDGCRAAAQPRLELGCCVLVGGGEGGRLGRFWRREEVSDSAKVFHFNREMCLYVRGGV